MDEADPQEQIHLLTRQLHRERAARRQAEDIAEEGLRRLYERQQLDGLLREAAEASAVASGVEAAMQATLNALGRYLQWPLGYALLVTQTDAGLRLRTSQATWGTVTPEQVPFNEAIRSVEHDIQVGLLGRVWRKRCTLWASDCARSWPGVHLDTSGLETAFAFPVLVQDEVVAVLAFFHRAVISPDETIMEASMQVGQLVGRVFERQRALEAQMATQLMLEEKVSERTSELEALTRQLTESARLKDEFLAAMSHELRTPLTAILGFAQVLEAHTHGPLNEKQMTAVNYIDEGGHHLLNLINDLLDLSKINAGQEKLTEAWLAPDALCRSTLQMVRPLAAARRLTLELRLPARLPLVWGDERRLRQILLNLLGNAIKFTEPGGRVMVEATGDSATGRVQIAIADTGIGIAPEFLSRLFTPFCQVDGRLARRFGGTGLGLALVKKLIQLHRGDITVASQLGMGSTFTIHLPPHGLGMIPPEPSP